MRDKTASGRCIRVVERKPDDVTITTAKLSPAILQEEFLCKTSSIEQETLFLVIANAKLYSVDGVNRRKGYVPINYDSGYPFPSGTVLGAKFFKKDELDNFISRDPTYLSSGYEVIELNF